VEPEAELILEDTTSLLDAMRRMVGYASDATEALEARIEDENPDGRTEAEELREALEQVNYLSFEISESMPTRTGTLAREAKAKLGGESEFGRRWTMARKRSSRGAIRAAPATTGRACSLTRSTSRTCPC
jgi:hypothetical protein